MGGDTGFKNSNLFVDYRKKVISLGFGGSQLDLRVEFVKVSDRERGSFRSQKGMVGEG